MQAEHSHGINTLLFANLSQTHIYDVSQNQPPQSLCRIHRCQKPRRWMSERGNRMPGCHELKPMYRTIDPREYGASHERGYGEVCGE